jgi:glycosyltransferase involved in cell wall biosynthesis
MRKESISVTMIIERYLPIWGGAEVQLHQLISRLEDRGCLVTVVTRRWHHHLPASEQQGKTRIVRLGMTGRGMFATASFVAALVSYVIVNRSKIDILHSHGAAKLGALCAAMARLLHLTNVSKVATAGKISQLLHSPLGRLILSMFRRSDAIVAMTDEIVSELTMIKSGCGRVARIPNGVDPVRFSLAGNDERWRFRRELDLGANSKIVLFAGRLVYRKGLDILLAAWERAVPSLPDTYLLILGSGADQADSVELVMREYVARNQIHQVLFVGESTQPEHFTAIADCFVFPSRQEGFPNALLEGMAAGLPVVAANIGGVAPLIKDGVTGILFTPENSRDCAEKLVALLSDHESAQRIGNAGRAFVTSHFSFDSVAEQYTTLYRELLVAKGFSKTGAVS